MTEARLVLSPRHAGVSESEQFLKGTSQIKILSGDDIEGMRVVCKVGVAGADPAGLVVLGFEIFSAFNLRLFVFA